MNTQTSLSVPSNEEKFPLSFVEYMAGQEPGAIACICKAWKSLGLWEETKKHLNSSKKEDTLRIFRQEILKMREVTAMLERAIAEDGCEKPAVEEQELKPHQRVFNAPLMVEVCNSEGERQPERTALFL